MKLWTIQTMACYEKLLQDKVIYGTPEFRMEEYSFQYEWLIKQMEDRLGNRPHSTCYPIWAWYQWLDSKRNFSDLRSPGHLYKGMEGVRLAIEKNENELLLSDFHSWIKPLHYNYLGKTKKDYTDFDIMLNRKRLRYAAFKDLTEELQTAMMKSWESIFDIDDYFRYSGVKRKDKRIQVTCWSLHLEEVVKVTKFVGR